MSVKALIGEWWGVFFSIWSLIPIIRLLGPIWHSRSWLLEAVVFQALSVEWHRFRMRLCNAVFPRSS